MAFSFQKRARTAPGVRLNVSKGGTSTAIGERGGAVKLSSKEVRAIGGIPGMGMSRSKETARTGCRKVDDAIADRRAALSAIVDRLNAMRFGMFGGPLKSAQKDLLALAKKHEAGAQKRTDAINRFRTKVCNELAAAHSSI